MKDDAEPFVYEIDLSKKYIIHFEDHLPLAVLENIRGKIHDWLTSKDQPFLILHGNIKLLKVDTTEEAKE